MVTVAQQYKLRIGDRPPNFILSGVDGRRHELTKELGRVGTVVVFWCNHCPYVQGHEGRLIELARRYMERGVAFFALNSNDAAQYPEDSFEEMMKRADEHQYPFPYLHDFTQDVARDFGAVCTPHALLFGPDGKLAYQGRISDAKEPSKATTHELADALEDLVAGRAVRTPQTMAFGCSVKWKATRPG
ncbi:MAG: thioredoxin family protein [Methanobacteriota archaeon]